MSTISKVLHRIAEESNGKMRIVKVPPERRPTAESLKKLDREIKAQTNALSTMEHRSYINANKDFLS